MKVIVVSHPARAAHVHLLREHLDVIATVVDTNSAWSGHNTALRIAAQHDERVVIMEDDAVPVQEFNKLSDYWALARPNDLLSFYLGTSRPKQFQRMIEQRMQESGNDADIWLPTLIHGVCYSVPQRAVQKVAETMSTLIRVREADFAVGAAWGLPVCYPIESLVQHRDEAPVERHPDGFPRLEPRVARQLAGRLMY